MWTRRRLPGRRQPDDLWAFCDEDLCRTVVMLAVPVISAVGHERDVNPARRRGGGSGLNPDPAARSRGRDRYPRPPAQAWPGRRCPRRVSQAAVFDPDCPLAAMAAGPGRAIRNERGKLNQKTREIRAAAVPRNSRPSRLGSAGALISACSRRLPRTNRLIRAAGTWRTGPGPARFRPGSWVGSVIRREEARDGSGSRSGP